MSTILLGTVALEPNRWGHVDPGWGPTIRMSDWLGPIGDAGFDGVELWEKHLTAADDSEVARVLASDVPVSIFNCYVSFDLEEPDFRSLAASWVDRSGATGVKYNVGNDADHEAEYIERVATWLSQMPEHVRLLCECHVGISIAEVPEVAARMFDAVGPAHRVQAIVHATSESDDYIRAEFDAYGDRISHVHLNDPPGWDERGARRLDDMRPELEHKVELLAALGFDGTWTIEFVHGTGTIHDEPGYLLERAAEDLVVLRDLVS